MKNLNEVPYIMGPVTRSMSAKACSSTSVQQSNQTRKRKADVDVNEQAAKQLKKMPLEFSSEEIKLLNLRKVEKKDVGKSSVLRENTSGSFFDISEMEFIDLIKSKIDGFRDRLSTDVSYSRRDKTTVHINNYMMLEMIESLRLINMLLEKYSPFSSMEESEELKNQIKSCYSNLWEDKSCELPQTYFSCENRSNLVRIYRVFLEFLH